MPKRSKAKIEESTSPKRYTRLISLLLFLVSIVLTANWAWNCFYPAYDYPVSDLDNIMRCPEAENISVAFVQAPVNTKELVKVMITDLSAKEFTLESTYEMVLFEENASFTMEPARFMPYAKVKDLEVTLNDEPIKLEVEEINGEKWYIMPRVSFEGNASVNKLKMRYTISREFNYTRLIRVPWLFTREKYAPIAHIPILSIPVQQGSRSERATVEVYFNSPYYRLCPEGSGWVGMYVPSKEELFKSYSYEIVDDVVFTNVPHFEHTISQSYKQYDSVHVFSTYFTEENFADRFSLIFVPNHAIFLFAISFLWSGHLIWIRPFRPKERSKYILTLGKIYLVNFFVMGIGTVLDIEFAFKLVREVLNLTNLYSLVIFSYPSLCLLAYHKTKRAVAKR